MKKNKKYVGSAKRNFQKFLIAVFGIVFGALTVGTDVAMANESTISGFLDQPDYELVQKENAQGPQELFKSEFNSIKELVYNGYKVQLEEATEGTVLLKNDNDALPLEKGSKISVFGGASVKPFNGGSGSGGIDTTEAISWYEAFSGVHFEAANPNKKVDGENYFEVNEKLHKNYESWCGGTAGQSGRPGNLGPHAPASSVSSVKIGEAPWDKVEASDGYAEIPNYGDAAFMIIKRMGGEGYDLPATSGKNEQYGNMNNKTAATNDGVYGDYLQLNENEKSTLAGLKELKAEGKIKKIVLILNMASVIQLDFLKNDTYDIDACVWAGGMGEFGTEAVTKLLVGENNFSGGLSATFWYDNLNNPVNSNFTDQNYFFTYDNHAEMGFVNDPAEAGEYQSSMFSYLVYQEGMYLGYKYTETRYEDYVMGTNNVGAYNYDEVVAYPFGYGTSYTTFDFSDFNVVENAKTYTVSVKVTNTGDVAGKTPVQIYVSKPYGEYERANKIQVPSVQLVDFGKTSELKAGASQTVTVEVSKKYLATYDTFGAGTYVFTPGEYRLTAAANAHEAVNNVLASKGYTPANTNNKMDAAGDKGMVWAKTYELDTQSYSLSSKTNNPIQNSFGFGDINTYSGKGDNSVEYYSRDNWEGTVKLSYRKADGTLVKPHAELTMTQQMADEVRDQMDASKVIEKGGEYPTYGKNVTIEADGSGTPNANAMKLIDLLGEPYDSNMWDDLLDQLTWMDTVRLLSNGRHKTIMVRSVMKPSTGDENGPNGYNTKYSAATAGSAYQGPTLPYAERIGDPDLDEGYSTTGFCSNGNLAATYNKEIAEKVGKQIGEEALWAGISGLLGTGLNIQRTNYIGRMSEYDSEDAMLSGLIAAPETAAIESMGVHCFIKHCAINESETARHGVQCWMTEQTMRENYFRAFEIVIQEGGAFNVMTSFSRIGTDAVANCVPFTKKFLREECGLPGIVETDCAGDMTDGKHGEAYVSRIVNVYTGATDLNEYNYGDKETDYAGSEYAWKDFAPTNTGVTDPNVGEQNGTGEYGNLGQAMRESAKRILFATLNSNAMSTMSSDMESRKITPAWKTWLSTANTAATVAFGLSVAWLVIDVLVKMNKIDVAKAVEKLEKKNNKYCD